MKKWLILYKHAVRKQQPSSDLKEQSTLSYWQNELFYTLLTYGLPVSLLATLFGLGFAVIHHDTTIGVVDIVCFIQFVWMTFATRLPLQVRKLLLICLLYVLAVYLTIELGYLGLGIFYLLCVSVIVALIMPIIFAYYSILFNTLLLVVLGTIMHLFAAPHPLNIQYPPSSWIAFSANLILLSGIIMLLIQRVFKRLERALLNKYQLTLKYQSLFEKSPLPMWLFDTETLCFIDVNVAAVQHYGYSREEFLQMKITDIRPPSEHATVENIVKANRQTGQYHEQYARHYKKNGELIDTKIESNLLELDGRLVRLVLAADITDQLKNEKEVQHAHQVIRQSETDLRAIFESTTDGFVLLDANNCIRQFNPQAEEYIRFNRLPEHFVAGRDIMTYLPEQLRDEFLRLLSRVYAGETIEYERQYRHGEEEAWVHYSLNPVRADDKITGICITGRDITATKTYIQKIEEQNATFRDIAWTQSHVARAPVARILGLVSLLQRPSNTEDFKTALQYLIESISELDTVIAEIIKKSTATTLREKPVTRGKQSKG